MNQLYYLQFQVLISVQCILCLRLSLQTKFNYQTHLQHSQNNSQTFYKKFMLGVLCSCPPLSLVSLLIVPHFLYLFENAVLDQAFLISMSRHMVSTENTDSFLLYYLKRNPRFAYFLNNRGLKSIIFPCVFHGFTNGSVIEIIFIKNLRMISLLFIISILNVL